MTIQTAFHTIIHKDRAAVRRAAELSLDLRSLDETLREGERAREESTDNDPVTAAGFFAYSYRIRKFRDLFCPRGWTKEVERGVEITRAPEGLHAVITRGGNEHVCNEHGFPQPQRKMGDGARDAVTATLALNPDFFNVAPEETPQCSVWILLVRRDGDTVKAELSLPTGVNEDGDVSGWYERIFLPEIDLDGTVERRRTPDEPLAGDDELEISRKR